MDEDLTLLKEYLSNSTKWSMIANKLSGRNCYNVKNRFDSLCRKFNIKKESENFEQEVEEMYRTIYETSKKKKDEIEEEPKKNEIPLIGTIAPQNPIVTNPSFFLFFVFTNLIC